MLEQMEEINEMRRLKMAAAILSFEKAHSEYRICETGQNHVVVGGVDSKHTFSDYEVTLKHIRTGGRFYGHALNPNVAIGIAFSALKQIVCED